MVAVRALGPFLCRRGEAVRGRNNRRAASQQAVDDLCANRIRGDASDDSHIVGEARRLRIFGERLKRLLGDTREGRAEFLVAIGPGLAGEPAGLSAHVLAGADEVQRGD
jgi:hypothetical protein